MTTSDPSAITPDDKDWTWVLERRCADCGFESAAVPVGDFAPMTGRTVVAWQQVLGADNVQTRPEPTIWSPLEYACHIRDVYELFAVRVRSMLEQDDPQFANWDQDVTAIEKQYHLQDPVLLFEELTENGQSMVDLLDSISGAQWIRPGRRSNGSVFTVESLVRYFLHDVVHHLHDVGHTLD